MSEVVEDMTSEEGISRRDGLYGFEFRDVDLRRATDRKTYQIKQLWQRSHEIINLAARGFKEVDIADIMGVTPATVSNTLNSDLGKAKLADIRLERDEEAKKTSEKIKVITNKALNIYHEIFDDETDQVSLKDKGKFAEGFLKDMSGLRAPVQVNTTSVHTTLTATEIEEFKQRGIKAARDSGMIVDGEFEEVKSLEGKNES